MNTQRKLVIKIISEDSPVTYFDLPNTPVIIGRSFASSDIVIEDPRISRVHLHVERAPDGGVRVMDLDTANGTLLAGKRLETKVMCQWGEGQEIVIGRTRLVLEGRAESSVPPEQAPPPGETNPAGTSAEPTPPVTSNTKLLIREGGPAALPGEHEFDARLRRTTMEMTILSKEAGTISRLVNVVGMVLVLALSLVLLAYVGFGEASRTFPTFELDKLFAQGDLVKTPMNTPLQVGAPLEQLPGFIPRTQPILDSDPSIVSIYVTDTRGRIVFANVQREAVESSLPNAVFDPANPPVFRGKGVSVGGSLQKEPVKGEKAPYTVTESDDLYRVSIDLESKFEQVGSLHVTLLKRVIEERINGEFRNVFIAGGVILAVFAVYAALDVFVLARRGTRGGRLLNVSYGLAFVVMAALVILTLVNLYTEGIRGKTEALARSLSQRLNTPAAVGLDIADFSEVDRVFAEYLTLNPDLSFIALTSDNVALISTDAAQVGAPWPAHPNTIEYTEKLERPDEFGAADMELHVGVPTSAIYSRLWGSVKNFVVLFVAAGFLSLLFFNLMQTFISKRALREGNVEAVIRAQQNALLGLVSPFYFLAVFAEGLATSFLPQYFKGLAVAANVDTSVVSTLFTVYFLSFVIALIPAGQFADRRGVKPLMILGTLLVSVSLLLMAFVTNFYAMFVIRALAGLGQGVLLIGVQSYILEMAAGGQKTRGAAIIVFGYNGGMISGTAIGALLAVYMQPKGVFLVGAATALFGLLYTLMLIPGVTPTKEAPVEGQPRRGFMQSLRNVIRDFEFVKAMLLIGIPAKAVLTGVTIFALPLLLARQNYAQEDIGQIIMLYAAGVLISSSYVSRLVDRVGKTTGILFTGTLGSGLGLVLIGLAGVESAPGDARTAMLIGGMFALGLSHGFIHAPIVTHISETAAADALGKSSATSLYRFLERIGHVSGPVIVGQLLLISGESLLAISWLGAATIVLGILFLVRIGRGVTRPGAPALEPSM